MYFSQLPDFLNMSFDISDFPKLLFPAAVKNKQRRKGVFAILL